MPGHWVLLLAILDSILDTLELRHPSLTHTYLEIAFLRV